MKNKVMKNVVFAFLLQITTTISGLIAPRLIIGTFGSEMNGMVSSITQFLSYISLLEGGVSGVIMASLYKPLLDNDSKRISGIFNATKKFFKQIAYIYIVYVLILSIVYPIFVNSTCNSWYISILCIVLGINSFVQYFYSLSLQILIKADQNVYFVSIVQIVITILNLILVVIGVKIFDDILVIKLISGLIFLVQPVMFTWFVKRNFEINKNEPPDTEALSQRWSGFGQNIAFFIHSNTDIVVLTLLSTLPMVSVYSVYMMVSGSLKRLVAAVSSAIVPSIGNVLASGDKEKINKAFDKYEFSLFFITTLIFSTGIISLIPFIKIYTSGITDANYVQPLFGILLMLSEMAYCYRDPYVNLAYAAGHFKQTAKYAYAEAIINIVVSVVLVKKFGLIGVAIGTLGAMIIRMVMHAIYLKKYILYRPLSKFYKSIISFGISSAALIVIAKLLIQYEPSSFLSWIVYTGGSFVGFAIVLSGISALLFRDIFGEFINNILKKGH